MRPGALRFARLVAARVQLGIPSTVADPDAGPMAPPAPPPPDSALFQVWRS